MLSNAGIATGVDPPGGGATITTSTLAVHGGVVEAWGGASQVPPLLGVTDAVLVSVPGVALEATTLVSV